MFSLYDYCYSLPSMWVVANPLIPIMGLFFSNITFHNKATRIAVVSASSLATVMIVLTVNIDNKMCAYFVGFFAAWNTLRTMMLFWIYEPRKDFLAIRLARNHRTGSLRIEWVAYPTSVGLKRLAWVVDLFLDFRAIAWCYSAKDGSPCTFHRRDEQPRMLKLQREERNLSRTMLFMSGRATLALVWIDLCQTSLFPRYQVEMPLPPPPHYDMALLQHSQRSVLLLTAVKLATFYTASFALIDVAYSGTCILSAILFTFGSETSLVGVAQGSPWGGLKAVCDHGIGGFWSKGWHNYLQLGFRTVANRLAPIDKQRQGKFGRLLPVGISFGLSGIIHMCASMMFRENNKPIKGQLVFFLLQPIGILCQSILLGPLKKIASGGVSSSMIYSICCVTWLYYTLPIMVDDLLMAGFWNVRLAPLLR